MSRSPRLFLVLNQAQHRLRKHLDRRCLQELGVTSAQLGAIHFIATNPRCSQQALADEFGQDPSALTVLLRRLESTGLVRREPHPEDGRTKALCLTEEGARVHRASKASLDALNRRLRQGFTADEIGTVNRFLVSIIERVDAGTL